MGLGERFIRQSYLDAARVNVHVVQAQRQELNCSRRVPGCFTLIGDRAPPAARDSSEVVILTPEIVGTFGV